MDAQFWHEAWSSERIGFHQAQVNQRLEEHWPALSIVPGTPVFVPLAGKSLDMLWLHRRGHPVLGVELSAKAVQAFFEENGLPYERVDDGPFELWSGTGEACGIRLFVGDFFALDAERLAAAVPASASGSPAAASVVGTVGAFYDRASLIAMDASLRAGYARHLGKLLPAGAAGLLIAIDYDTSRMQGPPFAVPDALVRDLLGEAFDIDQLAHHSGHERLGNLAARGLETLDERVYRLQRRPIDPI